MLDLHGLDVSLKVGDWSIYDSRLSHCKLSLHKSFRKAKDIVINNQSLSPKLVLRVWVVLQSNSKPSPTWDRCELYFKLVLPVPSYFFVWWSWLDSSIWLSLCVSLVHLSANIYSIAVRCARTLLLGESRPLARWTNFRSHHRSPVFSTPPAYIRIDKGVSRVWPALAFLHH